MHKAAILASAGICSLVIAGCANSMTSSSPASGPTAAPGGTRPMTTVGVRNVSGIGQVLVNSQGRTLYLDDQEKSGKILCAKADCTSTWMPLTMKGTKAPTGPSDVNNKLGTLKRPDGTTQVTLDGAPLYTFAEDRGPGSVNGNGAKDQFDGTSFSWHAATPNGPAAAPSGSSNGGYGGY